MKKLLWLICLSLCFAGCSTYDYRVQETRGTVDPCDDPVVATVNGRKIKQSQLLKILLPAKGWAVLDEIILLEIVRQYAHQQAITVTPETTQAQFERVMEEMAPGKSRREQQALFNYMLQSRNLSRTEFDLIVKRQSLLRRLVDPNVVVTDKMLTDEHHRQHGRKVIVGALILGSFRDIQEAQKLIEAGNEFGEIVKRYSQDQSSLARGAVLGPFSIADEHIPEPIRRESFALTSPRQQSKVFRYYDDDKMEWWCLLRLEEDFPPDGLDLADMRDELGKIIRRRTINQRMLTLLQKLKQQADIDLTQPPKI